MLRPLTGEILAGETRALQNATGRPLNAPTQSCAQTVSPALSGSPVKPSLLLNKRTGIHKKALVKNPVVAGPVVASPETPTCLDALNSPSFSYTDFARQLALKPGSTGAIAPSSKRLAKQTIRQATLKEAGTIVELGPGTGVFTEEILQNITRDQTFFAIELNQTFASATKHRCPDACVYHDAASSLPLWLANHHRSHADRIISSLPWTIFDKLEQEEMLGVISDSLSKGGVFVSIIYLGAKFRSRGRYFINNLQNHFSSVTHTPTVWQNLPPTQIFRCVK